MTRRTIGLLVTLALGLLVAPLAAGAQPHATLPRIGLLRPGSPPDPFAEAFRERLRELGYVEGRSITIEYRYAEGKLDRLPQLVDDLVRLPVDVLVPGGNIATRAAQQATSTIPIVMSSAIDPVAAGFVASLARPGGNITGSATLLQDLGGKRLELLKEALPQVSRVGVLYYRDVNPVELQETQAAARALGVHVKIREVGEPKDFEGAFEEWKTWRIEAISVLATAFFNAHRTLIINLAAQHRLPLKRTRG